MAKKKAMEMTLEQALSRLEEITETIEKAETPLEESLELYKEGFGISVFCAEKLAAVEKEVMELKKSAKGAGFALSAFDGENKKE